MYYSANWQLIEEEIDEDAAQSGFSVDRRMQYIWGTPGSGYIDDIIMRRQDDGNDGEFEDTWYHITDTLFSTVAILDDAAKLVERVSYDAYGRARHHRLGDLNGDGATTNDDGSILLGTDWGGYGVGDLDRNGVVGVSDYLMLNGDMGAALPPGRLSLTVNVVGYAGYIFNAEFNWSSGAGLYTVRHRHYAPELGRWLSRDPLGYIDGMSLYEYVYSSPATYVDSEGLQGTPIVPPPIPPTFNHPTPGRPGFPGGRGGRWDIIAQSIGAVLQAYMDDHFTKKAIEDCLASCRHPIIINLDPARGGLGKRRKDERNIDRSDPRFATRITGGNSIRCYNDPCEAARAIRPMIMHHSRAHRRWLSCVAKHGVGWCERYHGNDKSQSALYQSYLQQLDVARNACMLSADAASLLQQG